MLDTKEFFSDDNYVDDITEWTINEYNCVPEFRYYGSCMPRKPKMIFDQSFSDNISYSNNCFLNLGDYVYTFVAGGKTRGEAKHNVCRFAYEHLRSHDLLNLIKFEIENPNEQMAINQLEILSRRWQSISSKSFHGAVILICQNINTPKPTTKTVTLNGRLHV